MRKQMKIAAVVSATALLAIGASFTSMAAAKTGTWKLEEDGWYCYDKDGDVYENEFCLYEGKEYYVGDDGLMVTEEWVTTDDGTFYIGEDGSKTINTWMDLIPEDGDEEDDEERFYFGTKGKVTTGKKVIDGNTYYFDKDGYMLKGWVDHYVNPADSTKMITEQADSYTATMVYCDENGARVASQWINTYVPGEDEDAIEDGDAKTFWYWIKASGIPQTGRNLDINGQTYFFNSNAQMLHGWVVGTDTDSNNKDDSFATSSNAFEVANANVYFCGSKDQGYAKKNTWVNTWAPADFADADSDDDQYWYWAGKDGVILRAGSTASAANAVTFVNGAIDASVKFTPATSTHDLKIVTKEINNKTYGFKANGQMWSGLVDVNGVGVQYFGKKTDGAMKTGSVMIADADDNEYKFYFAEKTNSDQGYVKGAAVTGNANGDLYIKGLLRESNYKYEEVYVDALGVTFLIDADGDIRTSNKTYKDEDDRAYDHTATDFDDTKGVLNGSF